MMNNKINPYWYLAAGILLQTMIHMTFSLSIAAWIAYTPFLIFMYQTSGIKSRIWFVLALLVSWSLVTAKIITPPLKFYFEFMYSIPMTLVQIPGYLIWDRFKARRFGYLLFPAIMTIMEWIQYTFTPLASWGIAAYTQNDNLTILQTVSLFGMPGLSFIIYWINISFTKAYLKNSHSIVTLSVPFVTLTVLLIFGAIRVNIYHSKSHDTLLVAAVGTTSTVNGLPLPPERTEIKVRKTLFDDTKKAAKTGAKLIVWNEAATYMLPENETSWKNDLKQLAKDCHTSIYASYIVPISTNPLKYENKYLFLDKNGLIKAEYHKHEPVPGEPAVKGKENFITNTVDYTVTGGAICYDYDFPYIAKQFSKLNADIIAVPSSDWRGIDPVHTKMAAYRAIEQGHSILRSTRFGSSAAINPMGEMVSQMSSFNSNNRLLLASLPAKGLTTVYSILGDLLIYALLILVFVLFLLEEKRK
ncbi:nitrilase-related carbon-nitrogen hydrolase [Saccharicrinis sp. FJH54]|uniref:nitrilase-related carbon-nitrogen hydrolase n=1 Tax=Saccharicrinis sp. FJH54 TaxID=3344665 RepID=UPI0035D435FA